jgi:hypothetical protein
MNPDLSGARWRKSERSSGQGACVELAALPAAVAFRDSKDPNGPALLFGRPATTALMSRICAGELD